jgi:hypothetical protein
MQSAPHSKQRFAALDPDAIGADDPPRNAPLGTP